MDKERPGPHSDTNDFVVHIRLLIDNRDWKQESTSGGLDPLVDLVRSTALPVAGVAAKAENEGISGDVR
nr:hypothetical protein CFP56_78160 [Quercus suber]